MTLTNKQWTLLSIASVAVAAAIAIFGGHYRALCSLILPLCVWLSLKHEPEQMKVRPLIRVFGWIFVCLAVFAVIGAVISILAGR